MALGQCRGPATEHLLEAPAASVDGAQLSAYDGDPHPVIPSPAMSPSPDPTLARRARIARLTELGQRIGYTLFGLAVLVFAYGAISGFTNVGVSVVVASLALGSAVLAPAIVFGFGVKAAEREDRQQTARHRVQPRPAEGPDLEGRPAERADDASCGPSVSEDR